MICSILSESIIVLYYTLVNWDVDVMWMMFAGSDIIFWSKKR